MAKKVLITGITGFAGSHLAEHLLNQGHEVWGTYRWRSRQENIEHIRDKVKLLYADLNDQACLKDVIRESEPDCIFHLAASSYVKVSWDMPEQTLETNVIGTANLFEAVRASKTDPIIQIAGSSEEYGNVPKEELPITEETPLRPASPYAVSKAVMDLMGFQYFSSYGMRIVRTRSFNHTGPRRGEVFVCSNFSKQIALIEKGKQEPTIYYGNLKASRDFTDVRDIIRAYALAVDKCKPGDVYNIGSRSSHTVREVLDTLLSMSDKKISLKQDPKRIRPSDIEHLLCDDSKFRKATGWKPEIAFEQTLKDLLAYWREKV